MSTHQTLTLDPKSGWTEVAVAGVNRAVVQSQGSTVAVVRVAANDPGVSDASGWRLAPYAHADLDINAGDKLWLRAWPSQDNAPAVVNVRTSLRTVSVLA